MNARFSYPILLLLALVASACHKTTTTTTPLSFSWAGTEEAGQPIKFIPSGLIPGNQLWNFGDGTTSTEFIPQHIYANAGAFQVVLTVNGDTSTAVRDTIFIGPKHLSEMYGSKVWRHQYKPASPYPIYGTWQLMPDTTFSIDRVNGLYVKVHGADLPYHSSSDSTIKYFMLDHTRGPLTCELIYNFKNGSIWYSTDQHFSAASSSIVHIYYTP